MRSTRLRFFTILFLFFVSRSFSQTSALGFAPVYSQDSLQGFDMSLAKIQALGEGFYGQAYTIAIKRYQRNFVINKYDLYKDLVNPPVPGSTSFGLSKYSSGIVTNAPCVNEDFETGTLAGWTGSIGANSNSQAYPTMTAALGASSNLTVLTTPLTDPYVGSIPSSPLGGTNVVRINNDVADYSIVKLTQTFSVTPTNYLYDFAYWAVMQDAGASGTPHTCTATPFMLIKIRDNNNILQTCPTFSIVAPASGAGGCAGLGPLTWSTVISGGNTLKTSQGWQKFSIDLTPYLSSPYSNVTIEIFVGDCALGGHWGYAYFDSHCNTMDLTVNTQTLSMPNPSVYPQVQCGGTATMTAPAGLSPYSWSGPTGTSTSQSITTSVPGNYTLIMNPAGICNPISKVINLQFVPPTTVTATPANLCASGTNTSSTLSASGATSYTWQPGGSNASSIVVSPTTTTIYTLTANTGTCTGTYTVQVTVNPNPPVSVLSSNSSVCPGQSFTMTAFGANTYVWNPGGLTGSLVVVTQTATTTYSTIGTSTAGCSTTATTTIGSLSAPPVSILPNPAITGSICAGTAINLIGIGAPSFTWLPDNVTGIFQTFTPTVTTTYTAIGASGSCTNSAVLTVTIDPGPPISIALNPTITCPGNSTTLTATSASAVGAFTWNPGPTTGASITVTTTLAGGYSVSAVNSNNCKNTQTVNPNLSPAPSIVISPSPGTVCAGSSITFSPTGAIAYTWMPGGSTIANAVFTPTGNTTYTVIGANAAGCTSQATVAVTVISSPTITASSSPASICAGSCATITPSSAVSYTISGGTVSTSNFVVCPVTTSVYTIVGENASGCVSAPINVTVTVNPLPIVTANANPGTICSGSSSTLTANGASTYLWSTGATGSVIVVSPVSSQTYSVTGTSAAGCTGTASVNVNVTSPPSLTITPSTLSLCPGTGGSAVATGATSYTWQPGGMTVPNPLLLPSGSTIYTITGAIGTCTSQTTLPVTVLPQTTITASFNPPTICAGSCATLNTSGAAAYTITGLSAIACPTVSTGFSVFGVDVFGCPTNTIFSTLVVNSGPSLIASANPTAICPGDSSLVSATGGTSYNWQPGGVSGSSFYAKPLSTTIYTVIGTAANGCTAAATTTVVVNPAPTINVSPSSTTICQGSNVTLSASGATSYTWQPGSFFTSNITVSPSSNQTYTVTGASSGCSGQNTVAVTVAPIPTISAPFNPSSVCPANCATMTPSGALSYTITGLSAVACPTVTTPYSVVGSNAFGCVSAPYFGTLNVLPAPGISASAIPTVICPGDSSLVSALGGASYTWQPGGVSGSSFYAKPLTTTQYTVTGSNGSCTNAAVVTVSVISMSPLFVVASQTSICSGANVTLTAGGAASYSWSPGGFTGQTIFVQPTLNTVYTVTGSVGSCKSSATVGINVTTTPTVNISASTNNICPGAPVTLNLSGATTYSWSDGSTASPRTVNPLITTVYSVIGFNGACVSAAASVTITVNPSASITVNASPSSICAGQTAVLTANGAVNYTWQPGGLSGSTQNVTPSITTVYTVTGSNGFGCSGINTVVVNVSPALSISASANPSVICSGIATTLSATAGAASYVWNYPGGTLTGSVVGATPSVSTNYTLIASAGSCSMQIFVPVIVNPAPTTNISASSISICAGSCATLTANGATSYTWSNGTIGPNAVVCPTSMATYSVLAASGGCTATAQINISVTPAPSTSISGTASNICPGQTVVLTASGASSYNWNTGPTTQTIIVTPSVTTVYTVIGSNGTCSSAASYTVNVGSSLPISIVASSPSICAGFTVGLAAISVGPPGSYTWQPQNSTVTPQVLTPTVTTTYSVISNFGGCPSSASITILVVPLPTIVLSANPQTVCPGQTTTITATGGVTYSWIPSLQGGSVFIDNPIATKEYTVVGFDAVGCPNADTIDVFVTSGPNIVAVTNKTAVCPGGSATLTVSGAINYTWFPGGQASSVIVVSPGSPTTYTVIGNNGSAACAGSATINVNIATPPSIAAVASNPTICPGATVQLTATGGVSYTWSPTGAVGSVITDSPITTTTYTVLGEDLNGCTGTSTVLVQVSPMSVSTAASPSSICSGSSSTLTATGGISYTWSPGGSTNGTVVVTPGSSTTYTVMIYDGICLGTFTVPVTVFQTPTITISPSNPSICAGSSVTLTANGATTYTWLPAGNVSSVTIESPASLTNYTVIGVNGGICFGSATVDVFVNPVPDHVAANSVGTVGCSSPTAQLFGLCTDTNVSYFWTGPQSYSNSTQNPIISGIWGDFTLTVSDNATGCSATATVNVPTDNTIPSVTATASGSITCANIPVTLNAANTTTNPGYSWVGPAGFTSTLQTPTVGVSGAYTIVVTDLSSTCTGSAIVVVGTHTQVTISASIAPSTCDNNGNSNNDGIISVLGFTLTDKYDLVSGATYTGTATYATAANIPTNGVLASNLANPTTTLAYTIRLFDAQECHKDTTLYLVPVDCSLKTLGIAKEVSSPAVNADGSYNVTYTVVVKNYDLSKAKGTLNSIQLTEDLSAAFPSPSSFTIVNSPTVTSLGNNIAINSSFDGVTNKNLTLISGSVLDSQEADTITFSLKIKPGSFFIPYKNSITGQAITSSSVVVTDSSNTGMDPDPDHDNKPNNNNIPTVIIFLPNQLFGITKIGEIHPSDDASYDVTYTITVHNLGNDTLHHVSLNDSLFGKTIKNPATYSMRSGPFATGSELSVNSAYNGNTNSSLLIPEQSTLPPNSSRSVYFTINVVPGTVTYISNSAYGSALAAISLTDIAVLSDTSNAGNNPDTDTNFVCNEPSDNVPTVLLIPVPTHSLFIPEGFSPNGDNNNDYFVIQGLPDNSENSITIFNRWGNKVYHKGNYDNTWDGVPNVSGTLGKNKLPPGTYFYILELKSSGQKPITGFVVLQY